MERYITRALELVSLLEKNTVLLFGPRQTGKSSYLRQQLAGVVDRSYNLLDQGLLRRLLADPTLLRQELAARKYQDRVVCIDEIQKCPALLDEVQLLIEEEGLRFLLTGSSAGKLHQSGNNLLGGRGRDRVMRPLTWYELGSDFDLLHAFRSGLIPSHYLADDPEDALDSYVGRYLTEEIAAEGFARNIPDFSRFLTAATVCNAQELVFSSVASDAGLARQTVQSWFNILQETLLGEEVHAWTKSVKRKAIERAKFYFFDLGVVRALRGFPVVTEGSADFGPFFEHFVYMELAAWRDYRSPRSALNYWRSTSGFEVDFILGNHTGIEVKATSRVDDRDLRGLRALKEEGMLSRYVLVCREPTARLTSDGIEILPWAEFFGQLWAT
ncbi:MAG: ATP-binding protein [Rectinemataceae bacterium]